MKFLPAEVYVLGEKYEIIYSDDIADVMGFNLPSNSNDFSEKKIKIYSKQVDEDIVKDIIRKVLYIINDDLNIGLSDNDGSTITLLVFGLTDVLLHNDWLREV